MRAVEARTRNGSFRVSRTERMPCERELGVDGIGEIIERARGARESEQMNSSLRRFIFGRCCNRDRDLQRCHTANFHHSRSEYWSWGQAAIMWRGAARWQVYS